MSVRGRSGRGVTLVELLLTMGLSSILGLGFVSVVVWQTKLSVARLSDAAARQQANAVVLALKAAGSRVGYGFGHALDAAGLPATGVCTNGSYGAGWSRATTASHCQGLDNAGRNDRVRFSYVDPWALHFAGVDNPSAGPCAPGSTAPPDLTTLHFLSPAVLNGQQAQSGLPLQNQHAVGGTTYASFPAGVPLFVGGRCQGTTSPSAGTDQVVFLDAPFATAGDCGEVRHFARRLPSAPEAPLLSCLQGFAPGYALGLAEVLEFYTATDPMTGLPSLMMAQQAWGQPPVQVAVGVTRFEVRYGFATGAVAANVLLPSPGNVDDPFGAAFGGPLSWCREARAGDQGGACNLTDSNGVALGTADLQRRIIAMHVTFDIVATEQADQATAASGVPANAPTWTFQTMLRLENMLF